ncbi:unnamed protein product [Timema podura]|uniref:Oligopeptide transport permease C-like N-terminal domain-containing protein n=1 Tax=Timema podura TaxID=61482 RepID=A0ABN7NCD5_TIMPD|nr:unnamed protein product [Timema podura]
MNITTNSELVFVFNLDVHKRWLGHKQLFNVNQSFKSSRLKMGKIATLVFASVVVFLVVTYLPGLPPYMEFTAQSITPPMELKGALALNERLNNAEHLLKGEIKGPESFAVHKGSLYSGLHGGYIVKIVASKVIPVTKFGSSQCYC